MPAYKMQIQSDALPVVHAARKIPATTREKLKGELARMEKDGVIAKVDIPTEWVNSLVIVKKPNAALRICLDRRDLNKVIKREYFQLLSWEEISGRIADAQFFTKLDANHGYWQIPLHQESSILTTFNTPFGGYKFLRMPFGILSAQEVFHKRVCQYFDKIDGCETNIDDILVWGKTKEGHDRRLIKTLERAKEIKLTLNFENCMFRKTEIVCLGHKLSENGITPEHSKLDAILRMPVPENEQAVQRLLGMENYVAKFYPHITSATAQLRALLRKDADWKWEEKHQTSFERINVSKSSMFSIL